MFTIVDKQGRRRQVPDDYLVQDGEGVSVLEDGEVMHVPMMMMDSKALDASRHRPHSGVRTDEQNRVSDAAYNEYIDRLQNAWRMLGPSSVPVDTKVTDGDMESSYEAYKRRLSNAWRNP
jgi:hypothetical protein